MFKIFKRLKKKSITGSGVDAFITNAMNGNLGDRYQRWVYACITTIAKSIAQVDWELAQISKKTVNKIESHELLSLLYKFNPKTTKFNSMFLTMVYFLKDGDVAWILDVPKGRKKPQAIIVVPTSKLEVTKKDELGYPSMYKISVDGKKMTIDAKLVKIFRNPDPADPQKGKSVISAIKDVVDNDTKMVKWNVGLLNRGAVPSGAIEIKGSLDPKDAKLLKKQFQEVYGGYENVGSTMILQNGTSWKPFSIPPKDMEYIEGRKMNRDEILAIFGVPKILLGLEGTYNRSTSETAERMFNKNTLQPLMTMIVEQINIYITPLFGQGLWLDFTQLDIQDREQQLAEHTAGWNKWLTTNEIREALDKAPVKGGDDIYLPINLIPVIGGEQKSIKLKAERRIYSLKKENYIKRKIKNRDFEIEKKNESLGDSIFKALTKKNKNLVLKIGKKKSFQEQNENLRLEIERLFIKKLEGLFEKQKETVLENLDISEKGLDANPFNKDDEIKSMVSIIEPTYYEAMTKGAKLASKIASVEYIDITTLPETVKWVKKISKKYATDITELTYEKTIDVIQEGILDGIGTEKLAKNITELYDQMADTRSRVIARTESARSLTAGQSREWGEAGIDKFEWLTAGDSNVSAICQENSMKEWSLKETNMGTVEYSHPNCRCMFLPK